MNPIEGGAAAVTAALVAGTAYLVLRFPQSPWAWLSPWGAAWCVLLVLVGYTLLEARRGNSVAVTSTAEFQRPGSRRFLLLMSIFLTPLLVVVSLPIVVEVWRARRAGDGESD